jgi:DNA-binding PadR family transcriptional regulator
MTYSSELIKGTLKTIVLKLLADNKKMYGYEITQKVKELTQDRTTQTEYIGRRVRKYYSLSAAGKTVSKEKVSEMAAFMNTMALLLDLQPKTR